MVFQCSGGDEAAVEGDILVIFWIRQFVALISEKGAFHKQKAVRGDICIGKDMICFAVTVKVEKFIQLMLTCRFESLTGKVWMSSTDCCDGLCCVTPC